MKIYSTVLASVIVSLATLGSVNAAPGNSHQNGNKAGGHSQQKASKFTHRAPQKHQVNKSSKHKGKVVKKKSYRTKTYTVKKGDTLSRIARKTGTRISTLIRLNQHKLSARSKYRIYAGQHLKVRR